MTAPARITQADVDRAMKSVKSAGFDHARIVLDLSNTRIEIIIGEPAPDSAALAPPDEWTDDDV